MADHDTHDHTGVTGVPDLSAHTGDTSDAHDASAISVLDTAGNFTATDVEATLAELQDNIDAVGLAAGVSLVSITLGATYDNTSVTHTVNSTSYVAPAVFQFEFDWDFFPATHFRISAYGQANEAANTITMQLTTQAAPTNPVSSGGDDLVITNTAGVFNSGWIAVSDAMSGDTLMAVSRKGSNGSVDLSGRWVRVDFKIDA